jgi:protein SCO1
LAGGLGKIFVFPDSQRYLVDWDGSLKVGNGNIMKKYGMVGLGVVIGLTLVLVGWRAMGTAYTYQGTLIDPPISETDFTLTDQSGGTFRLSDQRGKIVMMFFGYTHCPDVCPVTLSNFKRIKEMLGNQAQHVEFVFITVDPERDSPAVLRQDLANYDPSIIGLTGTRPELEKVWKAYGVYQARVDNGTADYSVNHTSITYLIDPQGNWRMTYPFGMDIRDITSDLQHLIWEKS